MKKLNKLYLEGTHIPWNGDDSEIALFIEKYNEMLGDNVLDVGCGLGNILTYLENYDINYTGIDISSVSIDMCKKKFRNSGNFLNGDIINISSLKTYSTVFDIGCLHMVDFQFQKQVLEKYKSILFGESVIYIRFFSNNREKAPLFYYENLPIYGVSEKKILDTFDNFEVIGENEDTHTFDIAIRKTLILKKKL